MTMPRSMQHFTNGDRDQAALQDALIGSENAPDSPRDAEIGLVSYRNAAALVGSIVILECFEQARLVPR
jgi:hypothetical protein